MCLDLVTIKPRINLTITFKMHYQTSKNLYLECSPCLLGKKPMCLSQSKELHQSSNINKHNITHPICQMKTKLKSIKKHLSCLKMEQQLSNFMENLMKSIVPVMKRIKQNIGRWPQIKLCMTK